VLREAKPAKVKVSGDGCVFAEDDLGSMECVIEDHVPKGVKQCTLVLGDARWSMIAVDMFG
jgi:hypothetical protein